MWVYEFTLKMSNNWSNYATSAIHAGQDYNQWHNKDIVPPIVTSATFYKEDPTIEGVSINWKKQWAIGEIHAFE